MNEEIKQDDFYEDEDDLLNQKYQKYNEAVMWGTDWTTETIVSQLEKGNIDLNPDFQRRNAWKDEQKSALIESLILGVPVPQIILAERKDKKNAYIVIDGKQRLLSILNFYSKKEEEKSAPLKLKGLKILTQLNGKTFTDIEEDAILCDFLPQLENQTIRTIIIKAWPDENYLYTVFLRLNTGSLKLSPQELRQALHPGLFLNYINEYTMKENPIRDILKIKAPDKRMRDVEFLLRYFAFKNYMNLYDGSLKTFLDTTCKELNSRWENESNEIQNQLNELENAIIFTKEVFGDDSFKVYNNGYEKLLNRTIFDVFVIYFSNKENRNVLNNKRSEIKNAFENLMSSDKDFLLYTAVSTKNKNRTLYRFSKFNETMDALKK